MDPHKTDRKVAGIVRGKWSYNEKEYLLAALEFYDEAIFIDNQRSASRRRLRSKTGRRRQGEPCEDR